MQSILISESFRFAWSAAGPPFYSCVVSTFDALIMIEI